MTAQTDPGTEQDIVPLEALDALSEEGEPAGGWWPYLLRPPARVDAPTGTAEDDEREEQR